MVLHSSTQEDLREHHHVTTRVSLLNELDDKLFTDDTTKSLTFCNLYLTRSFFWKKRDTFQPKSSKLYLNSRSVIVYEFITRNYTTVGLQFGLCVCVSDLNDLQLYLVSENDRFLLWGLKTLHVSFVLVYQYD